MQVPNAGWHFSSGAEAHQLKWIGYTPSLIEGVVYLIHEGCAHHE